MYIQRNSIKFLSTLIVGVNYYKYNSNNFCFTVLDKFIPDFSSQIRLRLLDESVFAIMLSSKF